jgi:subtilisin-like proprotein convertase family protein
MSNNLPFVCWLRNYLLISCFFLLSTGLYGISQDEFIFKVPAVIKVVLTNELDQPHLEQERADWLQFKTTTDNQTILCGSKLVIKCTEKNQLKSIIATNRLCLLTALPNGLYLLQASNAFSAAVIANKLAKEKTIEIAYPVIRRKAELCSEYARMPNDPYFRYQWYLENRTSDGQPRGPDLNIRAAWPFAQGNNIVVGIADVGIELTHPDLINQACQSNHYNFLDLSTNVTPENKTEAHGTAVAGLICATGNNKLGIIGTAPKAKFASWKIISPSGYLASDDALMEMYQFHSQEIWVQNHSWGYNSDTLMPKTPLEEIGLSNAITSGRNGLGTIIVRAAGNKRQYYQRADDDAYLSDPGVITVAAAREDGRVASYSNPGACILVAGFSGDSYNGFDGLFTTDLTGTNGYNQIEFEEDWGDYTFYSYGFSGTSASAPLISGLAVLILSANPNLSYRDVQHILVISSKHYDLADPDISTNAAGLLVSHNLGFGIPDAGLAVYYASRWINRPKLTVLNFTNNNSSIIPAIGLSLAAEITDSKSYTNHLIFPCTPGDGLFPDKQIGPIPLEFVGLATNTLTQNLTNKAALISRGINYFSEKIDYVASAGATFAVIYNATSTNQSSNSYDLVLMGGLEFSRIPAVFIGKKDGELMISALQSNHVACSLAPSPASMKFYITNTLLCEHAGIRLHINYPNRGNLRIILTAPSGTQSVFQKPGKDTNQAPNDWTFYSTHHFLESSYGTWEIKVFSTVPGATGSIESAELILHGTSIDDSDHDGLDDSWELKHFGHLQSNAAEDPDLDGIPNSIEQLLNTNPNVDDRQFKIFINQWSDNILRFSWPSVKHKKYQLWQWDPQNNQNIPIAELINERLEQEFFINTGSANHFFLRLSTNP